VEQKEGAFSNFPISEETIKLLKGNILGTIIIWKHSIEVN
jgi:hypothetical protein